MGCLREDVWNVWTLNQHNTPENQILEADMGLDTQDEMVEEIRWNNKNKSQMFISTEGTNELYFQSMKKWACRFI